MSSSDDVLEVVPLGAGNEVGRSCIVATFRSKSVMLDCGIHPGYSGIMSLPFFDEVDLRGVDVALITHFHLDHCAAVPYLVNKTDFKGRVLMTHPTKAIYHSLLMDFVRLTKSSGDAGTRRSSADSCTRDMRCEKNIYADTEIHRDTHVLQRPSLYVFYAPESVRYMFSYSYSYLFCVMMLSNQSSSLRVRYICVCV